MDQSPKEIVEAQINAGISRDWDALRTLYADDLEYRDPDGILSGSEAAITHLQQQMVAFPDGGELTIHKIYESGNVGVAEWSAAMHNSGPITMADGTEIPATNQDVNLDVVTIYEIRDGRITSERNYWDNIALLAQLGLLPM